MTNPWDIKPDDTRHEDTIPTFIIFCEDDASEPTYFEFFETDIIKINCIRGQRSKLSNVYNVIDYCNLKEYFEPIKESKSKLKESAPFIWCVFDSDKKGENNEHHNFNTSIDTAQNLGFKVAWSNDAFELWILLHFEDVDPKNEIFKHRMAYYDRLTEIFKSLPEPNGMLSVALTHPQFNYKDGLKSQKKFSSIVLPEIKSKIKTAISRAKVLEEYFTLKNILPHEKAPCTLVHHLIEELIQKGGKEI